jgi:pyruvate dehydrogenase E1 component
MLRARGGLQSYPSRTKDPDGVDFSTGSVGLGAAAPLFAAAVRRYVDARFSPRPRSRFVSIIGDAELDEGNVWEAIADPATEGLGNVLWIVDCNRQSLDRVIPGVRIARWGQQFSAAGWHVVEAKYGEQLQAAFARPDGAALQRWIDDMPNEHYQSLFGLDGEEIRARFLDGAPAEVERFVAGIPDDDLAALVTDLGGHDLASLLRGLRECDAATDRPSVLFAYTVKGWGLPTAGNPRNHASLLSGDQIDELRGAVGLTPASEWDRFGEGTPAAVLAEARRGVFARPPRAVGNPITVPTATAVRTERPVSTQEVLGRILVELSRDDAVAPYLVTTAPDVATSTSLAGFINRMGVFSAVAKRSWSEDPLLRWSEGPTGQHIELGISEMNLFLLLGQLGLSWDLSDQRLLPVGTVYDPFICRGLDALIYSVYSGAQFVIAGTPSGVTLAPEGGAHQSTITASIGLELPNCRLLEPAYARALDWLVCDALGRISDGGRDEPGMSYFLRLTTRPLDQAPFAAASARLGEEVLRAQVLTGAYRLVDASALAVGGAPEVNLAGSGAVLPEVLAAAEELHDEGVAAHVIDITSLDRLYASWRRSVRSAVGSATAPALASSFRALFAAAPVVTVHDAASHAMAWLGSALGTMAVPLGVDEFGQSGTVGELYELHDLVPGRIVNAALGALAAV